MSRRCLNNKIKESVTAALITVVVFSSTLWSKTYYVDATNGKDSNSGTSESAAWKTISRVNGTRFQPGDFILFERGEIWYEQLVIRNDGADGNPITYGAYGIGPKPTITAMDFVRDWSKAAGRSNVWLTNTSTQTRIVVFDENLGKEARSISELNQEFEWYWESNVLYIFAKSNPAQTYAHPGIEVGRRNNAILGHNRNYYTIEGLELRGANGRKNSGAGLLLSGDFVTIKNCTFSFNFYAGVHAADAADNGTISNSEIHHNQDNGIALGKGSGWNIVDCLVYSNGHGPRVRSGILFDTSNTTVSRCTVYDNGNGSTQLGLTHGIYVNPTAKNVTIEDCVIFDHRNGNGINYDADSGHIRRNFIYDNYFSGIHLENQQQGGWVNIYNNIVYGNNCGIMLYDWQWNEKTKIRLYNNTVYNNNRYLKIPGKVELEPYELCILSNIKKLHIRNNIFYNSSAYFTIYSVRQRNMISDNNSIYKKSGPQNRTFCFYMGKRTFAGWREATDGDRNSIAEDPRFVSTSMQDPADFKLRCSSPCRGTGSTEVNFIVSKDFERRLFDGQDMGAFKATCGNEDQRSPRPPQNVRGIAN